METRVENTGDSLNDFCDALELASPTGATRFDCCVNALNNKMRCELTTLLNMASGMATFNIDPSTMGACDRRASGATPVTNSCSDVPP